MKKLKFMLAVMVFGLFVLAAGGSDDSSSSSGSSSNTEVPSVGDQCTISDDCFAASDEDSWDQMYKFINAKDETGIAQMMMAGQVVSVKAGTSAKVIDLGMLKTQVRLSSGELVYVPTEYCKK